MSDTSAMTASAPMVYFCAQRNRRTLVLATPPLNGIDYLEAADAADQTVLLLTFLRDPAPLGLGPAQIVIAGGENVTGIQVLSVTIETDRPDTLRIQVDRAGDFSAYALSLRADDTTAEPPPGVDPALSQVAFSFKAGCPVSADCLPILCCPAPAVAEPDINYLAKDYPGFVQVMLDRMAVLAPGWTERHTADLGVTLVEALAYVADHLSYRQDAVATEAYLGTARSRISLRRHAKLVDYRVDEGENARVWLHFSVKGEGVGLPLGTHVLPRVAGVPALIPPTAPLAKTMLAEAGAVFTTLVDATLSELLNEVAFYTWGDANCCLPAGATTATLAGHLDTLAAGDVLLFEEALGPLTGAPEDADRRHRWVVRLTAVRYTDRNGHALVDPANSDPAKNRITEIAWIAADALPFPLCLSSVTGKGNPVADVSVARGNMVPADHGMWQAASLGTVPDGPPAPVGGSGGDCCGTTPAFAPPPFFFPAVPAAPLTFARTFDATAPASAFAAPPTGAPPPRPQIRVTDDRGENWAEEGDLLSLGPLDQGYVVETERDGTSFLRFGDRDYGAAPEPGVSFSVQFRTGNGSAGNVGPDTLGHVLTPETRIHSLRNPLAGAGGRDPDTMESIRQRAPWAFRTQLRAVTEADYGDVAARDPAIREARGTLRWTGSWRTAFVAIDPAPPAPYVAASPPRDLARVTLKRMNLLRMAGVDLAVEPAIIVGLRVALAVCVLPRHRRTDVARALTQVLISGQTCDGMPGLLDPSRFRFGQTIYLSPIIAAVQAVEGVASVHATAFQRVADPARDAVADGFITMQRLEIARVDNDPSRPDRGILELALDGGQ
ncbi:MAG TPA: hypothetical protein VHS58_18845 [Acetobacteraceae bacterium]|jgi:hypothetical protein|nr:hypothetical protein [Acetobacteraceae bacterium]